MNTDFLFPPTSSSPEPASDGGESPPSSAPSASAAAKKARRQTAFYPNMNSTNKPNKPFSRSAAKRESVMALGSIEHLQHYFTKTGLSAKTNPLARKPNNNLVPALGGLTHLSMEMASSSHGPAFALPPSPAVPNNIRPAFPPVIKDYETDPETLRPGVIYDLDSVARAWWIDGDSMPPDEPSKHDSGVHLSVDSPGKHGGGGTDVLSLLKTTTRAVRSVRNYMVSLPDDSHGSNGAGPSLQFRPHSLSPAPTGSRRLQHAGRDPAADPLALIRKGALDVLGALRELEERARVPLSDDAYDAQSDHGSSAGGGPSRVASPASNSDADLPPEDVDQSFVISVVNVAGGSKQVAVWDDEEQSSDSELDPKEKRDAWDERLVLGSGWLYRQDVTREELREARAVVAAYLDVVDSALFGGPHGEKRGWVREKEKMEMDAVRLKIRRASSDSDDGSFGLDLGVGGGRSGRRMVSASMLDSMREMSVTEEPDEEEELLTPAVEDDDLPRWAKRDAFTDSPFARAHALLVALLPAALLPLLAAPESGHVDRTALLASLTSGQLLCVAYNAGVRKSRRPWGYISKDAIHDVAALEATLKSSGDAEKEQEKEKEEGKKGWTFRRTDNLRLWAAALKIRYMLPVVTPSQPTGASSQGHGHGTPSGTPLASPAGGISKFPRNATEPPILFDARLVARKEPGWEDVLEVLVLRWVAVVVEERRSGQ